MEIALLALLALFVGGTRCLQAQVFDQTVGRAGELDKVTSVIPTGNGQYATSAYRLNDRALLLRLQANGSALAGTYYAGPAVPLVPLQVRERPGQGFAWVGYGSDAGGTFPILTLTDANGFAPVSVKFKLTLPNGVTSSYSTARHLRIDPNTGDLFLGGDLWRQDHNRSELWLARLDAALNVRWIRILGYSTSVLLRGIQPAFDGGLLGVGRIGFTDNEGRGHTQLLAVKLNGVGNLAWSFRYQVQNVNTVSYDQELTDVDRDPVSTERRSLVTGFTTFFCPNPPLGNCDGMTASSALLGTLDETTGALTQVAGLSSLSAAATRGVSVVEDFARHEAGVLATQSDPSLETREGLLIRAVSASGGVVASRRFGDGPSGPFGADAKSLEAVRVGEPGYVFLLDQTDAAGTSREAVVRTDLALGSSGNCEAAQEVASAPASVESIAAPPVLRNGLLLNLNLNVEDFPFGVVPCDVTP